jgi:hypothetical protein
MKFAFIFITLALIAGVSIPFFGQSYGQVTWNTFEEKDGLFSIQVPSNWNVSEVSDTEKLAPIDYILRYNDKGNSFAWVELMISEPLYSNASAALESYQSYYSQFDDFNLTKPIECDTYTLNDEPACSFSSSQQLQGEQKRNVLSLVSIVPNGLQTDVAFITSNNIYEPFLPVGEYIIKSLTINSTAVTNTLQNLSMENIELEIPAIPTGNETILSEIPSIPSENETIQQQTDFPSIQTENASASQTFRSLNDTFVASDPQGFGVYDKKSSNTFRPGEDIILYIEPAGFEYGATSDGNKTLYTINFSADFTISDTQGNVLTGQEGLPVSEIISHHQNKEVFIPFTITQTTPFPQGNYLITYTIHDTNSGNSFDIVKEIVISDILAAPSQSESNSSPDANSPQTTNPNSLSQSARDFMSICAPIEVALYHSCNDLIRADGSLSYLGQNTFKCITSGSLIGGLASAVLPLDMVLEGLDILSEPTGCTGFVKMDVLKSVVGIDNILAQLGRILG